MRIRKIRNITFKNDYIDIKLIKDLKPLQKIGKLLKMPISDCFISDREVEIANIVPVKIEHKLNNNKLYMVLTNGTNNADYRFNTFLVNLCKDKDQKVVPDLLVATKKLSNNKKLKNENIKYKLIRCCKSPNTGELRYSTVTAMHNLITNSKIRSSSIERIIQMCISLKNYTVFDENHIKIANKISKFKDVKTGFDLSNLMEELIIDSHPDKTYKNKQYISRKLFRFSEELFNHRKIMNNYEKSYGNTTAIAVLNSCKDEQGYLDPDLRILVMNILNNNKVKTSDDLIALLRYCTKYDRNDEFDTLDIILKQNLNKNLVSYTNYFLRHKKTDCIEELFPLINFIKEQPRIDRHKTFKIIAELLNNNKIESISDFNDILLFCINGGKVHPGLLNFANQALKTKEVKLNDLPHLIDAVKNNKYRIHTFVNDKDINKVSSN